MTTAEKIYSASTSEDAANARLAERLARLIEDDIASNNVQAGGALGSLGELSERYAIGRAAVREGIGLLERRGLGRLRPGPCGGFIVAQPDAGTIGTELANYFRMTNVTARQLADGRDAIDLMAASMAALSDQDCALLNPADAHDAVKWHLQVRSHLAKKSGDVILPLFMTCLNNLTAEFAEGGATAAIRRQDWRTTAQHRAQELVSSIAAGDSASAMAVAEQLQQDLGEWLPADHCTLSLPTIETGRHEDDRTLATLVARRLAAEILRTASAGQKLGSEWDLCERFSVSRATLRQAIRQLQDIGLVECRRGRGNGLVVRDMRGTGGIRLVLAFLISHQMDPKAAGAILFQLNRCIPALAVSRATPEQRARLEELLARVKRSDQIDRYDLLRLVQCVSQLADSPIIDFFSRCLAAYEARFHPFLAERLPAAIQREYFDLLRLLLDRVEPGDAASLAWAKREASQVMLEMSRNRPI